MKKNFIGVLLLIGLSAGTYSEEDLQRSPLYDLLSNNYPMARSANFGLFEMPQERKAALDNAHEKVLRAITTNDSYSFRLAMLEFISVPREHQIQLAAIGKAFTYGAGPNGSSAAIAASAFNSTVSAAAEAAMKKANFSDVICSYFFREPIDTWFGIPYKRCTPDKVEELFRLLSSTNLTADNFYEHVRPSK